MEKGRHSHCASALNFLNGDLSEEDENGRSDVSDSEAEPGEFVLENLK
jgi:hypothetical protein